MNDGKRLKSQTRVALAICTIRRPQKLQALLAILRSQHWPTGSWLVVVDNDPLQSASRIVDSASATFPVNIEYVSEPVEGYATARNAALDSIPHDCAVCFLDDDAAIPTDWLRVMQSTSDDNPAALVRSRYAHVPVLPTDAAAVDRQASELLADGDYAPAGTSGLLIPTGWRPLARFDAYFNVSGGEDTDLLYRIEKLGGSEVIAQTIAIEQQRVTTWPLKDQLVHARWAGRLAVTVHQRSGDSTLGMRIRGFAGALAALAHCAARMLLMHKAGATGYFTLAACRWSTATSPIHAPSAFGRRPSSSSTPE
ncbi:MAG: glycosyltransferase [Candidatus Nanopelagicales bacterium]|nr:glycosyltransferase [Candidatus Nanopelagicales bacterium]